MFFQTPVIVFRPSVCCLIWIIRPYTAECFQISLSWSFISPCWLMSSLYHRNTCTVDEMFHHNLLIPTFSDRSYQQQLSLPPSIFVFLFNNLRLNVSHHTHTHAVINGSSSISNGVKRLLEVDWWKSCLPFSHTASSLFCCSASPFPPPPPQSHLRPPPMFSVPLFSR